ncbi:substrate-binding periplasmic protein [Rheinheimera maricola]|uniref:Transporter substrate-binding domain-containing protein n=1 Tax=Rheinheimera maricola TaxID=2793282 RepID=A0ABS7X9Z6_9GAMM|nr:transporter substrate-binding domain-containing protein [Rheinheimera maricola]MBZ9612379.1 transporter substrate-binding domain-containing protein [Rheinheimera maricola]
MSISAVSSRTSKSVMVVVWFCLAALAKAEPLQLNDIDWPPFFFPGQRQPQPGLGKALLNHCLVQLGYSFRYNNLPIKRTHYYMQTGELDITVYSYQAAREDAVVFGSEPLFVSSYGFAVKADSGINISQPADISALKFGHLAGLAHTPELNAVLAPMRVKQQVIESFELNTNLQQLISTPPRIDITANSRETLLWRIKNLGLSDKISVLDYELANKPYFIAVSKSSRSINDPTSFISEFDKCILQFKQNGSYGDVAAQYGL